MGRRRRSGFTAVKETRSHSMARQPTPHYTLVAPSADGTCCPCSALSDPCTCAGLIPIIRCRTRSALAELCGFHAFLDPEDPPVAYLENAIEMHTEHCISADGCVTSSNNHLRTISGIARYNPDSCAITGTRYLSLYDENPCGAAAHDLVEDDYLVTRLVVDRYTHTIVSETSTQRTSAPRPTCYNYAAGFWVNASGGGSESLQKPDTEQQALYRATKGLKWSDWALLTELPGCSALWELRSGTEDYDFAVRESEYQLEFPALTITEQATDPITGEPLWQSPGVPLNTTRQLTAQVEIRVDILRRPWNGGLWTLYKTEAFGPMTITGPQTLEGVVPNDRGYETAINNVRYRVVG